MSERVHMCPPGDSNVMPCCGRTPWETLFDRMTVDPNLVTCFGPAAGVYDCEGSWVDGRSSHVHECVFRFAGPHARDECECGAERDRLAAVDWAHK